MFESYLSQSLYTGQDVGAGYLCYHYTYGGRGIGWTDPCHRGGIPGPAIDKSKFLVRSI